MSPDEPVQPARDTTDADTLELEMGGIVNGDGDLPHDIGNMDGSDLDLLTDDDRRLHRLVKAWEVANIRALPSDWSDRTPAQRARWCGSSPVRGALSDEWDRAQRGTDEKLATTRATDWLANAVTADAWDDSAPPTPPTVCRIDGTTGALFAPGRVSRVFGSSGSAKSWMLKLGTLEVLKDGGCVLYLDGDGVWQDFREHMKALGLSRDDALSGRLHYSRIEGSLLGDDFRELLRSQPWGLIVFDGFNVTLNASGFKGAEDDGVTAFFASVLNPAADTGAAVVVIDHMKKDGETDHGSVFKRNNLTGTDYAIKRESAIAPGVRGYSAIKLTQKDRPGWATSLHASRGRDQELPFAFVVVDSTGDTGVPTVVTIQLDAPLDVLLSTTLSKANADAGTLRDLLRANPAGFDSGDAVRKALAAIGKSMDASRINAAAVVLVTNGEATRIQIGRKLDLRPVAQGVKP